MSEMRGRDKLKKLSFLVKLALIYYSLFSKKCLNRKFLKLKNKVGNINCFKRYCILKKIALHCGENVSVSENVTINNIDKLYIGDNVSIHTNCYLECFGGIEIGDDVSIAHGVSILSSTHNYNDMNVNIKDQGVSANKTIIKNNVWIGAKATILCGITIEEGCIVGANAVVTKDFDKNQIIGGVPAKIIRKRG